MPVIYLGPHPSLTVFHANVSCISVPLHMLLHPNVTPDTVPPFLLLLHPRVLGSLALHLTRQAAILSGSGHVRL